MGGHWAQTFLSLTPYCPVCTTLADVLDGAFYEFNSVLGTWLAINPFVIEKCAAPLPL